MLAVDAVRAQLRVGQLVILESRTTPARRTKSSSPRLGERLKAGKDFIWRFRERVDPGNVTHTTRSIPKVGRRVNEASTELAADLYGSIISTIVPVRRRRSRDGEAAGEHFRAVNIGLVNEIA